MRKIYGPNDRAELVAAVRRGEPVPTAARRLGVTLSTAYRWMRPRATSEQALARAQPTFVELVAAGAGGTALVVRVGPAEIEVRVGFDRALLREVVATLGGVA